MGEREDRMMGLPDGVSSDSIASKVFYAYWNRYTRSIGGRVPAEMKFWAIEKFQELKDGEDPSTGRRYNRTELTEEQIHPRRGRPPKAKPYKT